MLLCFNDDAIAGGREVFQTKNNARGFIEQRQLLHRLLLRRGADVDVPAAACVFGDAPRAAVIVFQTMTVPKQQPDFAIPDLTIGIGDAGGLEGTLVACRRRPAASSRSRRSGHYKSLNPSQRLEHAVPR